MPRSCRYLPRMRPVLVLAFIALACSATGAAPPECVAVTFPPVALRTDAACTVATHPLVERAFPDLAFARGPLCFAAGPVEATLGGGAAGVDIGVSVTAYSGITANPTAGVDLAPLPVPLVDPDGVPRTFFPFTAASVLELRLAEGARLLGELATRDTGWAEAGTGFLPAFVSERLVFTAGAGRLLKEATGELLLSGDEATGAPGRCARRSSSASSASCRARSSQHLTPGINPGTVKG